MKIFLTGDLHLNHQRVLDLASTREHFKNLKEMDRSIINQINEVVTDDDVLYILGDFALFIYKEQIRKYINSINGQLHFIMGNHDITSSFRELEKEGMTLPDGRCKMIVHTVGAQISYKNIIYILTHYPMELLGSGKSFRNFCSHLHEKPVESFDSINLGVDSPELPSNLRFAEPILFERAVELLEEKLKKESGNIMIKNYENRYKKYESYDMSEHLWASEDHYPIML